MYQTKCESLQNKTGGLKEILFHKRITAAFLPFVRVRWGEEGGVLVQPTAF